MDELFVVTHPHSDHDHVIVTHGFAQTFVITTQVPVEAAGFVSFATTPDAITHLRHLEYWRNRAVAALADARQLANDQRGPG